MTEDLISYAFNILITSFFTGIGTAIGTAFALWFIYEHVLKKSEKVKQLFIDKITNKRNKK